MNYPFGVIAVACATALPMCFVVPHSAAANSLEVGVTASASAGFSSANNEELEFLQAGGHDPGRNGLNLTGVELSLTGILDPYLLAQVSAVYLIDRHRDSVTELEEAYLATRSLPGGLQFKAGQYYTEFGRHNTQHQHVWAFVDQPVVLSRLLGPDGLRNPGARLSWLMPAPWYSEVFFGAQQADGETAVSFLWEPEETVGGHELGKRSGTGGLSNPIWSARWLNGVDISKTVSANFGVSALRGPNASGDDTDTRIFGLDLYMKWKPLQTQRGFPFVSWQTEWLTRNYETPETTLKDKGGYTQVLWGYAPGWMAGARAEYARGNDDSADDPLRDKRRRFSANLTWLPSESTKVRLQVNRDRAEHLPDGSATTVWLQYEIGFGKHAAHVF